jgi:hypothetical protein
MPARWRPLGAARLAELLLQHTEGNAAARRALRLALVAARGPQEMDQEVRKRMFSLDRSERCLDRRASLHNRPQLPCTSAPSGQIRAAARRASLST